jgi:hypothetical protein
MIGSNLKPGIWKTSWREDIGIVEDEENKS